MKFTEQLPKLAVITFFIVGAVILVSRLQKSTDNAVRVDVTVPQLSAVALQGEKLFEANCAQCHGQNASGTDKGPPLVHNIYNSGHHADQAFLLAAKRGVRQHHWPYGNMPKQPQVNDDQIAAIVKYVRELQAANGIVSRAHRM